MEDSSTNLDFSTHSFKFPKLHVRAADQRTSTWVRHNAHAATMSAPSETHSDDQSLGDSAYEFIDTDTESRDGNATESIASTDFGRPDDVASLADTEQSDESEAEETGIPSFTGLDGPAETPTLGQSTAVFLDDVENVSTHCIEFEEPGILGAENISVKHTVADFDEEQTISIGEHQKLRGDPNRLVATIRQTMTQQCLSTRVPLRILFVGSHEARQDIIHKIASSVAASGEGTQHGSGSRSSSLFNVVPVSAFGSGKTPEVELMHSSGYQINVEDVVTATNLKFEDEPDKPDVIKLTLDENCHYHSVPEASSFIIEPSWEAPHVAIFYYSDNDTIPLKRTRTLAKLFMSRHKIPSILISHKQLFDKSSGSVVVDQHAIHMCLESRDPSGRNHIHRRLPIDLASFLKVDSRQMNRNLAYLTGLHEPLDGSAQLSERSPEVSDSILQSTSEKENIFTQPTNNSLSHFPAMRPLLGFCLSIFLAVLISTSMWPSAPVNSVTINGNRTFTEPTSTISTTAVSSPISVSLSTATETSTSTTTITVTKATSMAPKPNGVAVKPPNELSKLPEAVKLKEEKPTICTAEVLGDREILIRIPSAAKLSWLSKDTLFMNISRDTSAITTERVYSTNDGIVLQISKKDAYGALNITIRTKRQPKINETFVVDFGTSWDREFWTMYGKFNERVAAEMKILDAQALELYEKVAAEGKVLSESALARLEEANKIAAKQAKALSLDLARGSAILSKEVGMKLEELTSKFSKEVKDLQERGATEIGSGLERAQVQSKLFWLKLRGDVVVYEDYKRKAEVFFKEAEKMKAAKKVKRGGCSKRRNKKCGKCKGQGKCASKCSKCAGSAA